MTQNLSHSRTGIVSSLNTPLLTFDLVLITVTLPNLAAPSEFLTPSWTHSVSHGVRLKAKCDKRPGIVTHLIKTSSDF